jgi:hypothetical protein
MRLDDVHILNPASSLIVESMFRGTNSTSDRKSEVLPQLVRAVALATLEMTGQDPSYLPHQTLPFS